MKILGTLLVTFFGTLGMTMAQDQSDSQRNSSKDSVLYGRQFLFSPKIDSLASGIPRLDSPFTLLPKRFYSERILDFLQLKISDLVFQLTNYQILKVECLLKPLTTR